MAKELNLNMRMDDEMMENLSEASKLLDVSVAQVVRLAIEDYLRPFLLIKEIKIKAKGSPEKSNAASNAQFKRWENVPAEERRKRAKPMMEGLRKIRPLITTEEKLARTPKTTGRGAYWKNIPVEERIERTRAMREGLRKSQEKRERLAGSSDAELLREPKTKTRSSKATESSVSPASQSPPW